MSGAFTDRYGTELEVGGEASFTGCARVTVSKPCGIHVEAAAFPALIAALYEAAGLPAPVILERPEIDPEGVKGIDGFRVLADPRAVHVGYSGYATVPLAPGHARHLASVIAAYADAAEAEAEPDPAEVEELAAFLAAELGNAPHPADEAAARAALRWFREREVPK